MKKHDEGYVLVYVTVVLLVFCLVATIILTGAHRNLQNQQKTIEQMKDQYVAEGMLEQIVAQWGTFKGNMVAGQEVGETGVLCTNVAVDGSVMLSATYGSVTVICELDANGKYLSFNIGAAATEPIESEPAAIGGASE